MCFDACPTSACLPYVAARAKAITPNAKLVVMVSECAEYKKRCSVVVKLLGPQALVSTHSNLDTTQLSVEGQQVEVTRAHAQLLNCCCLCCPYVRQVRDPVAGVFSAETMLRGMGVPLTWSLADPLSTTTTTASASSMPGDSDAAAMEEGVDPRFKVWARFSVECVALMLTKEWQQLMPRLI